MNSASEEKSILDNCDFWCDTDGDKVEKGVGRNHKTKFVWRVKNFSARTEQKGEFIDSDSFTIISQNDTVTRWKLRLYPYGDSDAKPGYSSFYLKSLETEARASFEVSITDEHGNKIIKLVSRTGDGIHFKPNQGFGKPEALSVDQLFENGIIDDVLILVCKMSVLETFYEIKQKQCLKMMDDLENAFKEKNSFDVTVNCGDASFKCSKFMLTTRSRVFKAMFQHDTKENQTNVVNIKDIDPKVLEEIVRYVHTGDSPNIKVLTKELLGAADFYQLDQLKDYCQEVLSETLNAENSIEILILSDMHSAVKLRKDALKYISENMKSVSESCDWKKKLADYPLLMAEIIESLMNIMSSNDTQRGDLKRSST